MAETKANDTPVETPIEKGKGKAADDTMDDDEDDSESGEVSRASLRQYQAPLNTELTSF